MVNWGTIKYIFEIPKQWFQTISNRVFNSYGTNFITVKDGYFGGLEVGVDVDQFNNQVKLAIGDKIVSSVDGVSPDQSGNVDLNAVRSINNLKPDDEGNLNINYPLSVDGVTADANRDINLNAVRKINGKYPNSVGEYNGVVESINEIAPDQNGNVLIEIVSSVDGILPDEYGNVELNSVRSINEHTPDQNGNVQIDIVSSVDGISPDETGNVVLNCVKQVDGISPNDAGDIDFALAANKWMMTDEQGHISYTDLVPIAVESPHPNGIVKMVGDTAYVEVDQYVDFHTAKQVIDSEKHFTSYQYFMEKDNDNVKNFTNIAGSNMLLRQMVDDQKTIGIGFVPYGYTGDIHQWVSPDGFHRMGMIGYYTNDQYGVSSWLDNNHLLAYGSKVIIGSLAYSTAPSTSLGVEIEAPANQATLVNPPTGSVDDAIATVGYVKSKVGGQGTVKSVDHVLPDDSGNVQMNAVRTINGQQPGLYGAFTGVVQSINDSLPDDSGHIDLAMVHTVDGVGYDADGNIQLNALTEDDYDTANGVARLNQDSKLDVSKLSPLTASKWVKTNSNGVLTTTDDTPITLPSGTTGYSGTQYIVENVTWTGTVLRVARRQLTFTNGVVTARGNVVNSDIATVEYNPS